MPTDTTVSVPEAGVPAPPTMPVPESSNGPAEAEAAMKAKIESMGKMSPAPTEAIPVKSQEDLVEALNGAIGFLSDGKAEPVRLPKTGSRVGGTKAPLDASVFVVLLAVASAIREVGATMPEVAPLGFDPMTDLLTRKGYGEVTQKLMQAAQSEPLKAALSKPPEPAPGPPSPAGPTGTAQPM